MSSTLVWRPTNKGGHDLPDDLKMALRRYEGRDELPHFLNVDDLSYLRGLRDAGIKSSQKLIDAIEKHGEIELEEIW